VRTGSTTERTDFSSPTIFCALSGFAQKSGELCSSSISFARFSCVAKSKTLLQLLEAGLKDADAILVLLEVRHGARL
jgi:hypothetical protein